MSSLLTLLTVVASLLTLIQTNPNVTQEQRQQIIALSSQALTLAQSQINNPVDNQSPSMDEDTNDQNQTPAPGASAPVGSIDSTINNFDDIVQPIITYSVGYGNQELVELTVTNNTSETVSIGGSSTSIAQKLGLTITNSTLGDLVTNLQFLSINVGVKKAQNDMFRLPLEIEPGKSEEVSVRLARPTNQTGTFNVEVGGKSVSVAVTEHTDQ